MSSATVNLESMLHFLLLAPRTFSSNYGSFLVLLGISQINHFTENLWNSHPICIFCALVNLWRHDHRD